jgi:hypothetical protein
LIQTTPPTPLKRTTGTENRGKRFKRNSWQSKKKQTKLLEQNSADLKETMKDIVGQGKDIKDAMLRSVDSQNRFNDRFFSFLESLGQNK